MRPIDNMGTWGLVLVIAGSAVFMTRPQALPLWLTIIGAWGLWYLGFALILVWGGLRLLQVISFATAHGKGSSRNQTHKRRRRAKTSIRAARVAKPAAAAQVAGTL